MVGLQWLGSNHLGENTYWSGSVIRSAAESQARQELLLPDADCHQKKVIGRYGYTPVRHVAQSTPLLPIQNRSVVCMTRV